MTAMREMMFSVIGHLKPQLINFVLNSRFLFERLEPVLDNIAGWQWNAVLGFQPEITQNSLD